MFTCDDENQIRSIMFEHLDVMIDEIAGSFDAGYFPEDVVRIYVDTCMNLLKLQKGIDEYHQKEKTKF